MLTGRLEAGGLLVGCEVGVDELDEAVEVFGGDLSCQGISFARRGVDESVTGGWG